MITATTTLNSTASAKRCLDSGKPVKMRTCKPGNNAKHPTAFFTGDENFEEREGDNHWWLIVAIPATALFKHSFKNLSGIKVKANLYKCGDHLSKPHFLSWQPIDTPEPNFHVPQFFTELEFQ